MQARYRRIREAAYEQGRAEYAGLSRDPTFRDFVTLFIAEGTKRDRNSIAIANSDPAVIVACVAWLRRLTERRLGYAVQVHEGRMTGRHWRSEHGVLTVRCHDTCLRARMQAWIDELRSEWLTLTGPGA